MDRENLPRDIIPYSRAAGVSGGMGRGSISAAFLMIPALLMVFLSSSYAGKNEWTSEKVGEALGSAACYYAKNSSLGIMAFRQEVWLYKSLFKPLDRWGIGWT